MAERPWSLSVTQLGGTVVVDGKPYQQVEHALDSLVPGTEGLFLLERVVDRVWIAGTFYGAFAIRDGKLSKLADKHGFALEMSGIEVDTALADLVARARRRQK